MGSVASSQTISQDLRSAQTGGLYVAPGSSVTPGGGVAITVQGGSGQSGASPSFAGAQFGYTGEDVTSMLDKIFSANQTQTETLASGLQASASQMGSLAAAVKAPEQTSLSTILPFAALGLLLVLLLKGR